MDDLLLSYSDLIDLYRLRLENKEGAEKILHHAFMYFDADGSGSINMGEFCSYIYIADID